MSSATPPSASLSSTASSTMPIGTPLETGSMRRLYELDEDQPEPLDFQPSTLNPRPQRPYGPPLPQGELASPGITDRLVGADLAPAYDTSDRLYFEPAE